MQPKLCLSATEPLRAVKDVANLAARATNLLNQPNGKGGVMVLPGFCGDDHYNILFREYLTHLGYDVIGWGQGRNTGHTSLDRQALYERVTNHYHKQGSPISLIGHSLGGIFARHIAHIMPETVKQVITLGSPFMVPVHDDGFTPASPVRELYLKLNPVAEDEEMLSLIRVPPPCPTTAIYSKGDGIVRWDLTLQPGDDHHVDNIEVLGSHMAMTLNADVWSLCADKLRQHMPEASVQAI
jgi:alpha-beta hydrolase superfamily lysophospholipase